MPNAEDHPINEMKDPREGKLDMGPEVIVPAENDIGTLSALPGLKKLFKQNVGNKTGCYGKLNFSDTQSAFDQIFGTQPTFYHEFENDEDTRNAKREIRRFIDEYQLDFSLLCTRWLSLVPTMMTLLSLFR